MTTIDPTLRFPLLLDPSLHAGAMPSLPVSPAPLAPPLAPLDAFGAATGPTPEARSLLHSTPAAPEVDGAALLARLAPTLAAAPSTHAFEAGDWAERRPGADWSVQPQAASAPRPAPDLPRPQVGILEDHGVDAAKATREQVLLAQMVLGLFAALAAMQRGDAPEAARDDVLRAMGVDPGAATAEQKQAVDDVLGFAQLILQQSGKRGGEPALQAVANFAAQQLAGTGARQIGGAAQGSQQYVGDGTVPPIRPRVDGQPLSIGETGNTGTSTGPHLDVRIKDANGNYVDPRPFLAEMDQHLQVGGKPLSEWRVSSNYGMRTHPVHGGQRFHAGVDYAIPSGTPITYSGEGEVTAHKPPGATGGGGNVTELTLPSGHVVQFLHLQSHG